MQWLWEITKLALLVLVVLLFTALIVWFISLFKILIPIIFVVLIIAWGCIKFNEFNQKSPKKSGSGGYFLDKITYKQRKVSGLDKMRIENTLEDISIDIASQVGSQIDISEALAKKSNKLVNNFDTIRDIGGIRRSYWRRPEKKFDVSFILTIKH